MSDQLEPELERVARMLAEAGPLPDAPATLRERALAIPDGGQAADADPTSPPPRGAAGVAGRARSCSLGVAAVVAAIAIVPTVLVTRGGDVGQRIELDARAVRAAGRRHARTSSRTATAARRSSCRVWKMPRPGHGTRLRGLARRAGRPPRARHVPHRPDGKATVSYYGAAQRAGRLPLALGDERAGRRRRHAERQDRALGSLT